MKIKPRDSIKCTLIELFIQSVLLWWERNGKYSDVLPCCQNINSPQKKQRKYPAVSHWLFTLLASRCRWALSRFCASWLFNFLQPEDFAHDLCALHFTTAELQHSLALFFCLKGKVLFVFVHTAPEDGSVALHSWDSGVFSFTSFIAVRFCFKQFARRKLHSQKVQKCLTSGSAHAHNGWFVPGLESNNHSLKIEKVQRLASSLKGEGRNAVGPFITVINRKRPRKTRYLVTKLMSPQKKWIKWRERVKGKEEGVVGRGSY